MINSIASHQIYTSKIKSKIAIFIKIETYFFFQRYQKMEPMDDVFNSSEYITETELNMMNLSHSKIIKCIIKKEDKQITTNKRYRSVMVDIWKTMPPQMILQTTTFNFKLTNEKTSGYNWCSHINMSFQSKDAKGTLKEIIHMVKVNRMFIDLSIRLESGKTVHFKIE